MEMSNKMGLKLYVFSSHHQTSTDLHTSKVCNSSPQQASMILIQLLMLEASTSNSLFSL